MDIYIKNGIYYTSYYILYDSWLILGGYLMKRAFMQVYVNDGDKAIEIYKRAFNANVGSVYKDDEGVIVHAELDIKGHVIALSDVSEDRETGNIMQFCIQYGEGNEADIRNAYSFLEEGSTINHPLGPCFYSSLMADFVDRFGVRWCLFI